MEPVDQDGENVAVGVMPPAGHSAAMEPVDQDGKNPTPTEP